MHIDLYTDGASRGNPGPGGYGTILIWGSHIKELSQGYKLTTNNRMELMAVIAGLEAIKKPGMHINVYSDSKYVVDAFNQHWIEGWKKKNFNKVKNPDLWKRLIQATSRHHVRYHWIKGHNNHPQNERCDQMAVAAAESGNLIIDDGYVIE